MTSQKVIAANRRNARRSTGPRSVAGKRKVAGNAFRHGLTVSIPAPAMTAAVARMIAAVAGEHASPQEVARVYPIVEAEVEVLRVRSARIALIELEIAGMAGGVQREANAIVQMLPRLMRLERFERRAMARRNRALRTLRKSWLRAVDQIAQVVHVQKQSRLLRRNVDKYRTSKQKSANALLRYRTRRSPRARPS